MSINIGGIDLLNEIIDLRYQLFRTQLLIELLSNKTRVTLTINEVKMAEDKAFELLKNKYPSLGLNKGNTK